MDRILEILLWAMECIIKCLIAIAGFYCMMSVILNTIIQ